MELAFASEMIEWRGPAPFYFIPVPKTQSLQIKSFASSISYGWGVLYTYATIANTTWETALMPKDGLYLLPIKKEIRLKLMLAAGQEIQVQLAFDL